MTEPAAHAKKDFFISYTQADRDWAEWIAWQLEEQGYTTVIQAWDFRPGDNFISQMHRSAQEAECTLAVLSPDYLTSGFAQAEWAAAFAQDPTGELGLLLPVRVRECDVKGLLRGVVYIDLVGQAETAAQVTLLAGVQGERVKPTEEPHFPGRASPRFPGAEPRAAQASHPSNLSALWRWLSNPKHQKTLALLGGGLAVVVGGLWQVYVHFSESDTSTSKPTPTITATDGGIVAGGDVTADVIQTGQGTVTYYGGISEERFQTLSEELGATKAALRSFFKILERKAVSPDDLDSTLRTIAKRHKELTEKLATFTSEDPAVNNLKAQAIEALEEGDFERAEALLTQAKEKDIQAARQMQETANKRLLSAAAIADEQGDLKNTQLAYAEAATYYQEAGKLVPADEEKALTFYLRTEGDAFYKAGKYVDAQAPLQRALAIGEQMLGAKEHDESKRIALGFTLMSLARVYVRQAKYAEAEHLYRRCLRLNSLQLMGPGSLFGAILLRDVARLYVTQGRYDEAEPRYERSLDIHENLLGPEHQEVGTSLNDLAGLYQDQGRYDEAEPLYQRALAIVEKTLGPEHPDVAGGLHNLAGLYQHQGRYDEAEPLYQRALAIAEKTLGPEHPHVAMGLRSWANLYQNQGRYDEAEPLYQRALAISEKTLGPEHPTVLKAHEDYAALQEKIKRQNSEEHEHEAAD